MYPKFLEDLVSFILILLFVFYLLSCFQLLETFYLQVRGGQLWGTDVYTVDSDLVAGIRCANFMLLAVYLKTQQDLSDID